MDAESGCVESGSIQSGAIKTGSAESAGAPPGNVKYRLAGVHKSFGALHVCRGIDLDIHEGEMVCLIGRSGCGKSTLLRCMNLLQPIDAGALWLDGTDISHPLLNPQAFRQKIGLVFQSYNLFPHMTALQNVTLAPQLLRKSSRQAHEAEAIALFERFDLAGRLNHYPDQLSGGQQQRVAIIRALAMQPEIVLFDEITSSLDPELVGEVLDVVRQLKDAGMTLVLATHEIAFARHAADKICFLDEGIITEEGPPGAVLDAPSHPRTREFLARMFF